jgi:hypothetical protein
VGKYKELQLKMKKLHNQFNATNKEKNDLEEIILKQEARINDISSKVSIIEKMLKEKNKELKENEANCLQLVKIIEEQKKMISSLQNNENLNSLSKKEKQTGAMNSSNKLINELKRTHLINPLVKDLMIENQEIIITNLKEENKRLKLEVISKKYYGVGSGLVNKTLEKSKIETTLPLIDQHYRVDDEGSNELLASKERADNLEEISIMMKKILEEN